MRVKKIVLVFLLFLIIITGKVYADMPEITATSAAVIECIDGKIIYSKNVDEKVYPASLTKVLTAIMVVENCELQEEVVVSENAINKVQAGYLTSGIKPGEKLTVEQLLNILLISSCNDVANVLAEHVGGSVDNFVVMMNDKAKEIGCTNSHFTNCDGSHDENNYSSAHDLAIIGRYAMQFDDIKKITRKTYYELSPTELYTKDDRYYPTANEMILSGSDNYYKYASGIKTGFTTPAGYCLMVYAEKYDMPFVAVVLKATTSDSRYNDAKTILEDSFRAYTLRTIVTEGTNIQTINVKHATPETKKLNAVSDKTIVAVVKEENKDIGIEPIVNLRPKIKAPIEEGTIIGEATYTIEGINYSVNLIAENKVKKSYTLLKFILIFVGIIILLGSLRIYGLYKRNKVLKKIRKN